MVFYIDRSIHNTLLMRELSEDEEVFFANLANKHRVGNCYLCGDIDSLETLSHRLGNPSGNIYRQIINHYSESGTVINTVGTVIVLSFEESIHQDKLPSILQTEDKVNFVPISAAQNWSQDHLCCLLGENLNDCDFYESIATYYCSKHGIKGLQIRFHHENGGGNTICHVLKKCVQNDKSTTLCIVDSDKKYGISKEYPQSPALGDTCLNAQEVSNALKHSNPFPPHMLYILDVHEVENLIPIAILQMLKQTELPDMRDGLDRLKSLIAVHDGEPILYYDFKDGFPYIKGLPQRAYWKQVLLELGYTEENMPPYDKKCDKLGNESNIVFPKLSNNNLLFRAITVLRAMNISSLSLESYLEPIWENLGQLMLTWGCASSQFSA